MRTFNVYRQERPVRLSSGEYEANLVRCGRVEARNGEDAIQQGKRLTKYPVVHELNRMGDEL